MTPRKPRTGPSVFLELAVALGLIALIMPLLFSVAYGGLLGNIGNNPILAFAVAGAFIIHLASGPSRREVLITLVLAAVLHFLYQRITGGFARYFGYMIINWGSFLGISSLLVLAVRAIRKRGEQRKSALSNLIAGGAFFYYWIVVGQPPVESTHSTHRNRYRYASYQATLTKKGRGLFRSLGGASAACRTEWALLQRRSHSRRQWGRPHRINVVRARTAVKGCGSTGPRAGPANQLKRPGCA